MNSIYGFTTNFLWRDSIKGNIYGSPMKILQCLPVEREHTEMEMVCVIENILWDN